LFILVLFTRIQFNNIQVSLDEKSTSESRYQIARNEVDRLNEIEKKLNSSEVDVSKYINEIKEDDIIDYIYGNIEDYNLDIASTGEIIVRSMSLKEGKVNEI
jgi:DNA-binding Lrp family transcriptional regulator